MRVANQRLLVLPWGHLAVGYLCYSLGIRLRYRQPPAGGAVLALALGTQFPDLIDKPLSWTLGILPSGRSLGHSLLFAALLGAVVWTVGKQYDRRAEAGALLVGHLSHVIADAVPAALCGQWTQLSTLLWPLLPVYEHPGETNRSIILFLLETALTDTVLFGFSLFFVAFVLWIYDGMPGGKSVLDSVFSEKSDQL